MDPGPFSLRKLVDLAHCRLRHEWSHTSSVAAAIINVHRDPKKPPIKPEELNPYTQTGGAGRAAKATAKEGVALLKRAWGVTSNAQ